MLVTGASRGIGRAIAIAMARDGAHVALHARRTENLREVAAEIEAHGRAAILVAADLEDAAAARRAGEKANAALGGTDILVNNAGTTSRAALLDAAPGDWARDLSVNVIAGLAMAQAVVPGMIERRWGRVINVASPYARVPSPGLGSYCASKAALEMLTKSMALEWAGSGVTANAIAPVQILTDLTRPSFEEPARRRLVESQIPVGRWATVDDVLGAVMLLASPASSMMTGQMLLIDGGRLLV